VYPWPHIFGGKPPADFQVVTARREGEQDNPADDATVGPPFDGPPPGRSDARAVLVDPLRQ
jgi:hypothetical protein